MPFHYHRQRFQGTSCVRFSVNTVDFVGDTRNERAIPWPTTCALHRRSTDCAKFRPIDLGYLPPKVGDETLYRFAIRSIQSVLIDSVGSEMYFSQSSHPGL